MRNGQPHMMPPLLTATLLASGLLLSACGGGSGGGSSGGAGTTTISGTAATGAAMAGATVSLSCGSSLTRTATADAVGFWSTSVPTTNLPCAVRASDGRDTHYSFTVGNGSDLIANVTPLTTLALAQVLAAAPASRFADLSATDLARLTEAAISAAISALNTVLADYALPAGFNPVTSLLTAAATGQAGNDHDRLLDQFGAANPDLDTLVDAAATGTMPALAAPARTPGAANLLAFFETFAGDYTLTVANAGGEGTTNATVQSLLPKDSARTVHLKANGDVVIDAVGRSITVTAANYPANVADTSTVDAWAEFSGSATTQNVINYRTNSGSKVPSLYITYDPDTGKLEISPSGFVDTGKGYTEGYAKLTGTAFVAPATPPAGSCTATAGDDRLAFTNGPADFCGFTREASESHPTHNLYYQFTSTEGGRGTTFVSFHLNSNDTFESISVNTSIGSGYGYSCGTGQEPACTGATLLRKANSTEFLLKDTPLANAAGDSITVNGLLIHPVGSTSGGSATAPTLTSFTPTSGAVGDTVTLTGTGFSTTPANNIVRFNRNTPGTAPQAEVVSATGTQLVVKVPADAATGALTVYIPDAGTVESATNFTVNGEAGGSNTLAATISAPFTGTYKLSCYSNGSSSALVERTVTVNTDGTSTLNGDAVIASGHGGRISYSGGWGSTTSHSIYGALHSTSITDNGTSFELRFNQDGSLVTDTNRSHSAYINGKGGTCTGISGPNMGSPLGKAELSALIGRHALTDTLDCTPDSGSRMPSGATAASIDSDGTLRLGGFSLAPAQYAVDDKRFTIRDAASFPPPATSPMALPPVQAFQLGGDIADGSGGSAHGSFLIQFDKHRQVTPQAILDMQPPYSRTVCKP